ncbi:terminase [Rhodococcus sp. CSLK01-03]|uniref:Terminase n=1 Tax=Rhodococcus indonesiensis TaxID=3055869 RepID=A0ABT7RM61_9NOCA|nr:terminase [Rhodococcus indonesiensis]MDM7488720.1 terminase [Rhodococcus indonesiensis]
MTDTEISELPPGYRLDPTTGAWLTAPWPTDPDAKADLIAHSLGPDIIDWAEWRTDEPGLVDYLTGKPWRFTPGQARFLILWYAYDPERGRWLYRSGVKRGAKGTGKDPFGGALCNIELVGRSQLVFDDERGAWTGQRHLLPLVQIASNSEAQSKDTLRIANAMLNQEARDYYNVDSGETRTILKDGGRLEVLTASERTNEGDPATFILLNESHHMTEGSGGHSLAAVARRNVGKSPATLQARIVEMTNAHQQGTDSVAERTYEAWQAQVSGKAKRADILYDSIEADPSTNLYDDDQRMRALQQAYSDAPWSDLERLSDEILDPRTSVADSIRYYLNGLAAAEDAWVDPRKFDALARPDLSLHDGEQIALFLDCSKSSDATGLVAARLSDGFVATLGMWQRPHGDRGKGWLAPRHEVDALVRQTFDRYQVVWFGVDPSPARDDENEALYWAETIDGFHRDFHRKLKVWATPGAQGNSVRFDMRMSERGGRDRNKAFTEQAELVQRAIDEEGTLLHDGDPGLRIHTHNAKRRPNQWGMTLGKENRDSNKLVDLAVCMVGALLGRRMALNSTKLGKPRSGKATFV